MCICGVFDQIFKFFNQFLIILVYVVLFLVYLCLISNYCCCNYLISILYLAENSLIKASNTSLTLSNTYLNTYCDSYFTNLFFRQNLNRAICMVPNNQLLDSDKIALRQELRLSDYTRDLVRKQLVNRLFLDSSVNQVIKYSVQFFFVVMSNCCKNKLLEISILPCHADLHTIEHCRTFHEVMHL